MTVPYDGKYVSNKDVRNEGITTEQASDETISAAILQAERDFEMWAGRWFYRLPSSTITLNGGWSYFPFSGFVETTDILQMPIPIITLTGINIFGQDWDMSNFIVFSSIGPPNDDRWNPRIISKLHQWPEEGVQNIALTGEFGFVEDKTNYTVPLRVKIACRKLAIRYCGIKKMNPANSAEREMDLNQTNIASEGLAGYKYQFRKDFRKNADTVWYSGDAEIDEVVEYYRYKKFFVDVR